MKIINLDEIIEKTTGEDTRLMYSGHVNEMRACITEAIRQALEIAAEEAEITYTPGTPYEDPETGDECAELNISVDKQSILNVIDRVK